MLHLLGKVHSPTSRTTKCLPPKQFTRTTTELHFPRRYSSAYIVCMYGERSATSSRCFDSRPRSRIRVRRAHNSSRSNWQSVCRFPRPPPSTYGRILNTDGLVGLIRLYRCLFMELESANLLLMHTLVDNGGQGLIEGSATLKIKTRLGLQ